MAAQNNVDWYAMMWDLRGRRYCRDPHGFVALDPPPAYHGAVVALPGAPIHDMVRQARDLPGFAVKDCAGQNDLTGWGLQKLFDAAWIWHAGDADGPNAGWVQITSPDDLTRWEDGWQATSPVGQRQFPPAILAREDVGVFGRRQGDRFDAGLIALRSGDCVGLSNVFGEVVWPVAAGLCAAFAGGAAFGGL